MTDTTKALLVLVYRKTLPHNYKRRYYPYRGEWLSARALLRRGMAERVVGGFRLTPKGISWGRRLAGIGYGIPT